MFAAKSIVGMGLGISALFMTPQLRSQSNATPTDSSLLPYASSTDSARLQDGRVIHLVCEGHGSPTVILTAAKGGWAADWNKVQPVLAEKTRVCAWDRAGFGLSSASAVPQTVDNTTSDLEAALKIRNVTGPYVLVGHSMGSYETLLMADRHPKNVAGIVLIDPSIPDQVALLQKATPARYAFFSHADEQTVAILDKCASAMKNGTVRLGAPDPDGCLTPPQPPPSSPPALGDALLEAFKEAGSAGYATVASYFGSSDQDAKIVVNPHRNFGAKPLVVLTAADAPNETDLPPAVAAEFPQQNDVFRQGFAAYAALSTQGVHQDVVGTGHSIQQEKPQAVIEAVNRVVDAVRLHPGTQ